jgi:TRAP-type C4-dicarboxylate transport system permease small subunit
MSTHYLTQKVFKGLDSVVKLLTWIGNGAIALITLIFMIDVCGRAFLNKPLYGSNELIELTMIILGFAIVYATWTKQHVKMDILSPRLPRRTQAILKSIGLLLEFGISALIAYEVFMKALNMLKIHEVSPFLSIPTGPAVFALSISFFVSCLTSLLQAVSPHVSEEKSEGGSAT